jgi:hypothetical protein
VAPLGRRRPTSRGSCRLPRRPSGRPSPCPSPRCRPPAELPPVRRRRRAPPAVRPTALLTPPGALPCVGAWIGIASKALECGRAHFTRGEWDEAARAFDQAVRGGTERDLLAEARYWHAETLERLGRPEQADWLFRQVVQASGGRGDWVVWSRHASGWTALRLRDWARARDTFAPLLAAAMPASIQPWARHGLGLAQYALGRYEDAFATWEALAAAGPPPALARDVAFWLGDARAVGQPSAPPPSHSSSRAAAPAARPGLRPLGWWSLHGRAAEAPPRYTRTWRRRCPAASPVKPSKTGRRPARAGAAPGDVDGAGLARSRPPPPITRCACAWCAL